MISVIGAGSWGTAIAMMLGERHDDVILWTRDEKRAASMQRTRVNDTYLPNHTFPPSISVTSDLAVAARSDWIILSLPSQHIRSVGVRMAPLMNPRANVLNASKGLESPEGTRLSQVILSWSEDMATDRFAVLSGPNHAEEVAGGQPTTSVVASTDTKLAEAWQRRLMTPMFRIYTHDDVVGVELGGALKNVIALATGMADGLGFGDNTKAAIITRGLAEISRLGVQLGADPLTFSGLSGVGDLVATCVSDHSRNTRAGQKIGQGMVPGDVIKQFHPMVIEGIPTCRATTSLAERLGVDMPITEAVYRVLFDGERPKDAVQNLMARGPKSEHDALHP